MSRKPKFKPVITRVKLNPEQAVLTCACFSYGVVPSGDSQRWNGVWNHACVSGSRVEDGYGGCSGTGAPVMHQGQAGAVSS